MKYGDQYTNYLKNAITGERIPYTATYKRTTWWKLHTNNEGDGLWQDDVQLIGTATFTVRGCKTEKAAKAKIRKYIMRGSDK